MTPGWIKIHRKMLQWEWADCPQMVALWVHLILRAAYEPTTWHGMELTQGQIVTTYPQLSAATGLTEKQIRVCFARLIEGGQITTERAGKRQVVTLCNFEVYQAFDETQGQEKDTQRAGKGQINGAQMAGKGHANNKEVKKERNKEDKNININNPQPPLQGAAPEKTVREKCHAVTRYDRAWEEMYAQLTGDAFLWTKRENVAVNTIVGRITQIMEAGGRDPTDDEKDNALRVFAQRLWDTGDLWIRTNFVPHVIADKFNEYYLTIKQQEKNGKRNQNNTSATGVSSDYLERCLRDLAG